MTPEQQASANFLQNSAPLPGAGGGNFIEKSLPTIGSIGGGILGTVFGGPLGGIAGSAAGDALGQEGENLATGSTGSTLGAAESGGIGQALGGLAGGVAGSLLGKLGDVAANAGAGNAIKAEFGGVSKAIRDGLNMNTNAQVFNDYGLPFTRDTISQVSPVVTGSADSPEGQAILHKGTVSAMMNTPNAVDVTGTQDLLNSLTKDPGNLDAVSKPALTALNNGVGQRLSAAQLEAAPGMVGSLKETDAPKIFELQQELEGLGHNASNPSLGNIYLKVAGSLDQALQAAGANDVAAEGLYSPKDLAALSAVSPKLAEAASQVKTVAENRALQRPFVQASQLANAAAKAAEGSFGTASSQGANLGGAAGILAGLAHMVHPVLGTAAKVGTHVAGQIPPEMMQNITGALARVANPKVGGALGDIVANAGGSGSNSNPQGGAAVNNQTQSVGGTGAGFNPNQAAQYLMQAIQVNPYAASSLAPVLASLLPQLQKTGAAQASLGNLQQLYQNATGGPGILNALAGFIPGTAAQQYNAAAGPAQQTLGSAGVSFAPPSLMASPQTASLAFGGPTSALGAIAQPQNFQGSPGAVQPALLASLPLGSY